MKLEFSVLVFVGCTLSILSGCNSAMDSHDSETKKKPAVQKLEIKIPDAEESADPGKQRS